MVNVVEVRNIVNEIEDAIREEVDRDPYQFIDEEGFVFIPESDIDRFIEEKYGSDFEIENDQLVDMIHSQLDINSICSEIKDMVEDYRLYNQNSLAYHGLRQSDFI